MIMVDFFLKMKVPVTTHSVHYNIATCVYIPAIDAHTLSYASFTFFTSTKCFLDLAIAIQG